MGLDAQALTTLTREKFAESLVDNQGKTGVATMSEASEVAKSVISTYQQALIEGNPLILSRIGHLVILDKSARPGRNPETSNGRSQDDPSNVFRHWQISVAKSGAD